MDAIPISWLFAVLFFLILCSAFFSSSETSMMALNRYRLKHLKQSGHRGARKASRLLGRTDRLIGLILIGNNLDNIADASLATAIAVRLYGDAGYFIATATLTVVILIFAEVTPKTFAALYPEKVAFPASYILQPLQVIFYPLVFVTNHITNAIIRWLGGNPQYIQNDDLSFEEMRVLVQESGGQIPKKRRGMLMNILDLENVVVNDIMIPRNEIYSMDINDSPQILLDQIRASEYTHIPLFRDELDDLVGILHLRQTSRFLGPAQRDDNGDQVILDKRAMIESAREPYYIPEGTPLHTQLFNFQREKRRIGIVVDEYGVVLGLVTIEDILEEIVGDYTTNFTEQFADITHLEDGSFVITGSATIRDINRQLEWDLPTQGAKTLNGLILEQLESFPDASGVSIELDNYRFEILDVQDNMISSVRSLRMQTAKKTAYNED
ncbi:MAG: HlyC/CorC family transporter [Pseudomonadales bacterium]